MKEVEKLIDQRFKDGRVGMIQVHQARYHRMEAEIELLRLKGKGK